MIVASKLYKTCNTPAALRRLSDGTLTTLHVEDKEQRKLVLAAVKKAGYRSPVIKDPASSSGSSSTVLSKPSSNMKKVASPKKRKRDDNLNPYLPDAIPGVTTEYDSLDFDELLDERALMSKFVVVNRAPIMTAWATVVAERMGFKREEALSIASVYTEVNATSKGVKLGKLEERNLNGLEASEGGGQPYINFMGRRLPVFSTQSSQWRALLKGEPVSPSSAFKYITSSLRQTTGHIMGAMRLLAETYTPKELNNVAFGLYAEFRPQVEGWGKKGEVRCETILAARRSEPQSERADTAVVVTSNLNETIQEPDMKRSKVETSVEDYEAALDAEGYDDLLTEIGL
ncbi:hypothetical protein K439DRAFT_1380652, partial [Ramaria rubella]